MSVLGPLSSWSLVLRDPQTSTQAPGLEDCLQKCSPLLKQNKTPNRLCSRALKCGSGVCPNCYRTGPCESGRGQSVTQ